MNKGNSLVILTVILGILLLIATGAAGYFYSQSQTTNSPATSELSGLKAIKTLPVTQASSSNETSDWKVYRNGVAGFEFKYPPSFTIGEGESKPDNLTTTGYKFSVSLYYGDKYANVAIGGVTSDFTQGRGGMLTDTQGYVEKNNTFYCTFISHELPFADGVSVESTTNQSGVKMLVIHGVIKQPTPSEEMGMYGCGNPGPNKILVLINLPGSRYRGLGIEYDKDSQYFTKAQFDLMLSTIRLTD